MVWSKYLRGRVCFRYLRWTLWTRLIWLSTTHNKSPPWPLVQRITFWSANCLLKTVRPGTGACVCLGWITRRPTIACHTAGYWGCNRSGRCTSLALPVCLRDRSGPYMQIVYMSVTLDGSGTRSSPSLVVLLHCYTMAEDDTSQSLHWSATVASDGVFEQTLQMDAKHFRVCNSCLRVRSCSGKPMHCQYRPLTEQSPVDMKETFG